MDSKRAYNSFATFGRIAVGLQGLSTLLLAVLLLITGSIFMGSKYDLAPAVVDDIVCDEATDRPCGVAVTYRYKGQQYTGTFETLRATGYNPGDTIYVRVNPADPLTISEDMPWRTIGFGMVLGALALGYIAWFLMHLVSDNKNIAALAGGLAFLKVLLV